MPGRGKDPPFEIWITCVRFSMLQRITELRSSRKRNFGALLKRRRAVLWLGKGKEKVVNHVVQKVLLHVANRPENEIKYDILPCQFLSYFVPSCRTFPVVSFCPVVLSSRLVFSYSIVFSSLFVLSCPVLSFYFVLVLSKTYVRITCREISVARCCKVLLTRKEESGDSGSGYDQVDTKLKRVQGGGGVNREWDNFVTCRKDSRRQKHDIQPCTSCF
jgi:hypothetical protein